MKRGGKGKKDPCCIFWLAHSQAIAQLFIAYSTLDFCSHVGEPGNEAIVWPEPGTSMSIVQ